MKVFSYATLPQGVQRQFMAAYSNGRRTGDARWQHSAKTSSNSEKFYVFTVRKNKAPAHRLLAQFLANKVYPTCRLLNIATPAAGETASAYL
ncbi:hypothetical protein [Microbulbifer aggregans]|uniref:hypothetical protein n=1 Tax=Microbulbifer aggregans TaxID=1769779 RepID=UPI001CFCE723|nr:hypothetical protein [Microbulbifer aggregans]